MKVEVFSRKQMAELEPRPNTVVISIHGDEGPLDLSRWDAIHAFFFHDIEEREEIMARASVPFTMDMAREIWNIVHNNPEKDFIVHCAAGVSRSVAVGLFIHEETRRELITHAIGTTEFANGLVLRLLHRLMWQNGE